MAQVKVYGSHVFLTSIQDQLSDIIHSYIGDELQLNYEVNL